MKNFIFLAVLFFGTSMVQAQTTDPQSEIISFDCSFMASYNSANHSALLDKYDIDAVHIDHEGTLTRGAQNIVDRLAQQFQRDGATLLMRQESLKRAGKQDVFVAEGSYEMYVPMDLYDLDLYSDCKYVNTVVKEGNHWKITKTVLKSPNQRDPKVEKNIEKYSDLWDEILNEGRIDLINSENFTEDILLHTEPVNIVGIQAVADYFENFLDGFSDIEFSINNIFGEGDQLVKHWTFKGKHIGPFFGIPATGNQVNLSGSTIARMTSDGRVAEERDFIDNMALLSQLGVVSSPENIPVVDALYKSFAKGDIAGAVATMDPKIVWNEAENFPYADRNPYIGSDAVVEGVFARIGAEWEYWNLEDIQLHEMSNNMVLSTLRYKAKHKKTGKLLDGQTAHLFTLKDGKIIAFQQYTDTKKVAEVMR